ncbi:hypothetical protein BCR34DRAFT_563448 [Clohesyomyces aquaticus]|uniref:2EXR domain-containing protein n=1 Tax=Clohesyomyces aquaticus TaxID=1231657 RepID=A0A1Y1ZQW5_9PLEO|nr:hypothetical protein BCR34DRAFT_563448 [Clohesyomyces aquaticus]
MDATLQPAPTSSSQETPHAFPFLSLPTELRLRIYSLLLVNPSVYFLLVVGPPRPRPYNDRKPLYPAILRTCRKIHSEAVSVLYGANTWLLESYQPRKNPRYLSARNECLIRRVITMLHWNGGLAPGAEGECEIRSRFESMGIDWEGLTLWAAMVKKRQLEGWEECERNEWLGIVGWDRMGQLGVRRSWFPEYFLDERSGMGWVVKREGRGRG